MTVMPEKKTENEEDAKAWREIKPEDVKKTILAKYPAKVARKRSKHFVINKKKDEQNYEEIQANVRTIPGIISQRGCCYAGCKGVVMGPTRDIINLTHGPIGCGFYSWLTRRNQTDPSTTPDGHNFMTYCFSTDMQDEEVIFGGEKKLAQAIQEAYDIFKPKMISVFSTCPIGLIGDDIHAVTRKMQEKLGITIFGFSCEGYKGVSQSAGHHVANNGLFKHVIGQDDTVGEGKYRVNLLGEYNIGGDEFIIDEIFEKCGIKIVSTFSGNSSVDHFRNSHTADLNLIMCHRSINYVADMMEEKYGIPWMKVNFLGAKATSASLRKIAQYYGDQELIDRVEAVIAEEMVAVEKAQADVRPRLEGKLAMMFVGGSRAHHYQELFSEMGMQTIAAGYEFAHRDDYEGRHVLPTIRVDADSRNIEELTVEKDPERYNPRIPEEELKAEERHGIKLKEYEGMMADMEEGFTYAIDDISQYETEKMIEIYKPAIFCAGIKEKYMVQKHGMPMKQLHSYDSGGPYAVYKGAINFYYEIDRMINSKVWGHIRAPWEESPELTAMYADE
ncbi:Nitrogenase molybdenum-iron protein alpha chain [Desulfosarcina cetonica]|uniref:nitrogenase molybdenum-iron protein alpha chain n=1 Tax=Desulfosarcina cetonica TaxID=90730 RepID=UPI0006D148C0|nr:nitrogenase molybdenum-iron protein alpha chain [Desulfosarcina cetonica]VTR67909.1 Nitrogenase molybdenum-iron protein alpha chain [Desulfosarcina cetonica]